VLSLRTGHADGKEPEDPSGKPHTTCSVKSEPGMSGSKVIREALHVIVSSGFSWPSSA
jgi:hypothetical protein